MSLSHFGSVTTHCKKGSDLSTHDDSHDWLVLLSTTTVSDWSSGVSVNKMVLTRVPLKYRTDGATEGVKTLDSRNTNHCTTYSLVI